MNKEKIPCLNIGGLKAYPPIMQGGMGVRVSGSNLAAAVANEGGIGVIAGVGLGKFEDVTPRNFIEINNQALRDEIHNARSKTKGILGVNLMVVLSNYEELVKVAVEENIDLIISGSGLPLELPALTKGKDIKLVPVVSSGRAFQIICKKWKKNYNKLPDAVIVEGKLAGGHLGFSADAILKNEVPDLEVMFKEVLEVANSYEPKIPVIPAGGIFDGHDVAKFLKLGASGVQMATRFVCTDECDAHVNFKNSYIQAKKDDVTIVNSPVGLPGRVINSNFVEKIKKGETIPFVCYYHCLKTCNPKTAPYCIAKVLVNAFKGNMDEGFSFAGSNCYKCTEIVPVKKVFQDILKELDTEGYSL